MSRDYLTHWVVGMICTTVWFWGRSWGLPPDAITLAAATVPGLVGHALAYTPNDTHTADPAAATAGQT